MRMRLYLALACTAAAMSPSPAPGQERETEVDAKDVVWEAWRAVSEQYYDPRFGGVDWPGIGGKYLSMPYGDLDAAHAAIRDMLSLLDQPATRFLTGDQAAALLAEFDGDLGPGVGLIELLSVDTSERTGDIVVVTPVPDTPAADAGLMTGDVILAVDGRSTDTMDLAATMEVLRGSPGSVADIVARRDGERLSFPVTRAHVEPARSLETRVIDWNGKEFGYLGLRLFNQEAAQSFVDAVQRMEGRGVDGYVLDLRNNPGGFVPTLQSIAGALMGSVPLASLQSREGKQEMVAEGEKLTTRPIVALVNEGTASAAEVLAAAMQHHDRGLILGVKTFGKGLAHGYVALSDGSAVTPTVGRLESLDGVDILTHGMTPDVEVPSVTHPVVDPSVEVASEADRQFQEAVRRLEGGSS